MLTRGRRIVLEVLLALAIANAILLAALLGEPTGWAGSRDGVYVAVAAAFALAFGVLTLVRDRWPRAAVVVAALLVCAYYTFGLPPIGVVLPLAVFLLATTLAGHRWFAIAVALALFVVATCFQLVGGARPGVVLGYELLSNLAIAALAIALAEVARARRELVSSRERQLALAAEAARAEAEREHLAERGRIARSLHDDLGHSLAIVSLHAHALAERLAAEPAAATGLGHIRDAAAEGLAQLREAVRALGSGPAAAPRPHGLAELDDLVTSLRDGGVAVDVESPGGGLSARDASLAFILIREGVTNALRHARPRRARIAVGAESGELRVLVEHDGVADAAGPVTPGNGLLGLEAAVAGAGGRIAWERTDGGFRLEATWPERGGASGESAAGAGA